MLNKKISISFLSFVSDRNGYYSDGLEVSNDNIDDEFIIKLKALYRRAKKHFLSKGIEEYMVSDVSIYDCDEKSPLELILQCCFTQWISTFMSNIESFKEVNVNKIQIQILKNEYGNDCFSIISVLKEDNLLIHGDDIYKYLEESQLFSNNNNVIMLYKYISESTLKDFLKVNFSIECYEGIYYEIT